MRHDRIMDDLPPLPPGLVAVTGDEGAGKTRLLCRIAAGHGDALWLDPALPGDDDRTPLQVWDALRARCPKWDATLQRDLAEALDLTQHEAKQLFMLSRGSRRKVALVGLLAAGTQVTCIDQPYAALDAASCGVLRDFLFDVSAHETRTWVVADYEADPALPWKARIALG
jgi:ABC-type transport system involved in cytochrome c biogenesis ATPase subunit